MIKVARITAVFCLVLLSVLSTVTTNLIYPEGNEKRTDERVLENVPASPVVEETPLSEEQVLFQRCYKERFHGYWDDTTNSMRSFDTTCDAHLQTLIQEPKMPNPTATNMTDEKHTSSTLFDQLDGSCILLFGDSTDRQIVEHWCPRWMENVSSSQDVQLWMPDHVTAHDATREVIRERGGLRCSPQNKFTFGNYMHYGIAPPPYWKWAHTNLPDISPDLAWGNTTYDRLVNDVPKFFQHCDRAGHDKLKVIVVQSYIWDLASEWTLHGTKRPHVSMIQEWAHNVTLFVNQVRDTLPTDVVIVWRFAGPMETASGRDAQAIYDMNEALSALKISERVDFVVDYGAVLSSTLASVTNKGPFDLHPPALPITAYLNMLLNAMVLARKVYKEGKFYDAFGLSPKQQ